MVIVIAVDENQSPGTVQFRRARFLRAAIPVYRSIITPVL